MERTPTCVLSKFRFARGQKTRAARKREKSPTLTLLCALPSLPPPRGDSAHLQYHLSTKSLCRTQVTRCRGLWLRLTQLSLPLRPPTWVPVGSDPVSQRACPWPSAVAPCPSTLLSPPQMTPFFGFHLFSFLGIFPFQQM